MKIQSFFILILGRFALVQSLDFVHADFQHAKAQEQRNFCAGLNAFFISLPPTIQEFFRF